MKRPGDPEFVISSPAAGDELTPTFSVYGTCPPGTTGIVVTVEGVPSQPATVSPTTPTAWESLFTNVPAGTHQVSVQAGGSQPPPPPQPITVTVVGTTNPAPVLIDAVMPPRPEDTPAGPGGNPWGGWRVTGTYDPTQIQYIEVYLTQAGSPILQPLATAPRPIMAPAVLHSKAQKFNINLGFVPAAYAGTDFSVHFKATQSSGTPLRGSFDTYFDGPTTSTEG
jgi:hypothetical protein